MGREARSLIQRLTCLTLAFFKVSLQLSQPGQRGQPGSAEG